MNKARRALSLVEAVLGATVLALAGAMILSLLPSTLLSVRRSERQMQAAALAQTLLEAQKLVSFQDLVAGSIYDFPSQTTADGVELKPERTVAATASQNARSVRITVRWKERERDFSIFREMVVANLLR